MDDKRRERERRVNLTWELLGLRHGDGRSVAKDLEEEDREVDLQ